MDIIGWNVNLPNCFHNITSIDAMPVRDYNSKTESGSRTRQYVNIRFRLRDNTKIYSFLNGLAGANRYLWNAALAKAKNDDAETGKAKTTQFDLYKWYKEHKDAVAPWLSEYPVTCEVDAVESTVDDRGIGVDRNCGQVADRTGQIHYLTAAERVEKRIRKLQTRLAKKEKGSNSWRKTKKTITRHQRKIANLRKNDLRHIALNITTTSSLVFLEDLKTKGMTASAKGTVAEPGKKVKQEAGLNRSILSTGWGQLESYLAERGVVQKVNPAYTSQMCSQCGYVDAGNRGSQSVFRCLMCEYLIHADVNAALNIRASGMASWQKSNGSRAYVRPVVVERKPAIRQRALTEQKELECLGHTGI